MATEEDSATSDVNYQDERLHIDCAVNTSPGTSEVYLVCPLLDRLLSTCPSFYFFFFFGLTYCFKLVLISLFYLQ
jgi:hypothetical protein